jgi:hypothetical protein
MLAPAHGGNRLSADILVPPAGLGGNVRGKTKPGSRKTVLEETGNIAEVDAQNSVIFLLCLPN